MRPSGLAVKKERGEWITPKLAPLHKVLGNEPGSEGVREREGEGVKE